MPVTNKAQTAASWIPRLNNILTQDLWEVVRILSEQHELKVNLGYSVKSGILTGATCFGAALALGPIGFVVGAVGGSLASYTMFKNKYKSAWEVISELPEDERKKFLNHLKNILETNGVVLSGTLALCTNDMPIEVLIIQGIEMFFREKGGRVVSTLTNSLTSN